jgi:hypothetical protein
MVGLDRKGNLTALQAKRRLAKQLTPPAVQGRNIGAVIAGDRLEIIDGGDHLRGDAVFLADHLEEHL